MHACARSLTLGGLLKADESNTFPAWKLDRDPTLNQETPEGLSLLTLLAEAEDLTLLPLPVDMELTPELME